MNKNKIIQFAKYIAVFLWLNLLTKTDSFYSVYLLIGILSIIVIAKSKKTSDHNTWLEYIFAFFLSFAVTLSNYLIFITETTANTLSILIPILLAFTTFTCGFIVFLNIITSARTIYLKTIKKQNDSPQKIFLICFLIFCFIDILVFFTCCYPGSLTPDSIDEIGQILSGNYSNHHPFYFTMLIYPFISIGTNLFNDINIGIALYNIFQILILSAAFAYSISTLYRVGVSKKLLIILSTILALLPYNIIFSFTVWKDVLFGAAFLFFIVTLYRYFNNISLYKKSKIFQIFLIFISGLTICLFRSNALVAIFISTILFFVIFRKKHLKLGIILTLVVVSAFILKRPILKAINVPQPDIIESLSIPSQQIVKTIKVEKANIDSQSLSLINGIADIDKLTSAYLPHTQDAIKEIIREEGDQTQLYQKPLDYIKLYLNLGLKYPNHYLSAWIDQTKGYWNSGYYYTIWYDEIEINDYDIKRQNDIPFLHSILTNYLNIFMKANFLRPLISIGLAIWIILLLLYRNVLNKKHELLFLLMPLILTWATLLIATPVFAEFRYTYFLFTCLPFLTLITITNKPSASANSINGKREKKK